MAGRLKAAKGMEVPGPGTYEAGVEAVIESVRTNKFGSG